MKKKCELILFIICFFSSSAMANDSSISNLLEQLKQNTPNNQFVMQNNGDVIRNLRFFLSSDQLGLKSNSNPDDVVKTFLYQYGKLFSSNISSEFQRIGKNEGNYAKYFYQQVVDGNPVFGGWLQINIKKEKDYWIIYNISARYIPNSEKYFFKSTIASSDIKNIIATEHEIKSTNDVPFQEPRLLVYDKALLAPECPKCQKYDHEPILVWKSTFISPKYNYSPVTTLIDATSGDTVLELSKTQGATFRIGIILPATSRIGCYNYDILEEELGYEVNFYTWFDVNGSCAHSGTCPENPSCPADYPDCERFSDIDGGRAYDYVTSIYHFFQGNFGREYIARPEEDQEIIIHRPMTEMPDRGPYNRPYFTPCERRNFSPDMPGYYRMFTSGGRHVFPEGYITSDMIGHELTHSFMEGEAVLGMDVYETGALVEHLGDAFAHFFGVWRGDDSNWEVGEDTPDGVIRRFDRPSLLQYPIYNTGDSEMLYLGEAPYPEHYSEYTDMPLFPDWGGNHYNLTILHKAMYLMTDGGDHHEYHVIGIGEEKVKQIYYRTATQELATHVVEGETPSDYDFNYANFIDFATDIMNSCNAFAETGEHGIIQNNCCQVRNAFAATGILLGDVDCDNTPDPLDSDRDGDGIPNSTDNCEDRFNPEQEDQDGDHLGDICDSDIDNDAVANEEDNCLYIVNTDQTDTDEDSLGDACDNCYGVWNPDQADLDEDGLGNVCDVDRDGDGVPFPDDECPDVYAPEPDIGEVCSEDYACSSDGCPPRRLIENNFSIRFSLDEDKLDPPVFPWPPELLFAGGIFDDLCALVDCTGKPDFLKQQRLIMDFELIMNIPIGLNPYKTVQLTIALVDSNGNVAGKNTVQIWPKENNLSNSQITFMPFGQVNNNGKLSYSLGITLSSDDPNNLAFLSQAMVELKGTLKFQYAN